MDFIDGDVEYYAFDHTQSEGEFLRQLEGEIYERLEIPHMCTGRIEGQFLNMMAHLIGARRIIEVGTFGGYASLSMAAALPDDGELFTCDIDPVAIKFAKSFFAQSPHGKKITLLEGAATETLKTLSGSFDMAFIDADKQNYKNYYELILPMIRTGGLIAVDNVLWSGRVLKPSDESDHAINDFNKAIVKDKRVDKVMLTLRDGVYLLRKK
ncbi:MAG: methyltransferase [Candidatus Nitrohelix vancouverensis]|uniref:Methyltransferase n=1 Tax=Candidatus Nitrohelix vancouverensis TaxID=2705534 RepID=A0A7T0BZP3_9BACT|nr:MAG: methyltransferase [Candidatus Nitrohelix vancouverensis]